MFTTGFWSAGLEGTAARMNQCLLGYGPKTDFPAAAAGNKGMMALATDEDRIYYSDGSDWLQCATKDAAEYIATHAALTASHGVSGTIADVADIAVDANLSAAAQAAVTASHTQGTDTTLGTMTAPIAMGNNKITGLATPTAAADAVTKAYADSLMAGGGFIANMGVLWYGNAADCPSGWHICDGTDGTPDMRGLVPKGCPAGTEPGVTGGAATHDHDAHTSLTHSGCNVANHSSLTHSGCSVASHGTLSHTGCAVAAHDDLTHTGCAVAAHSSLSHSNCSVASHPATDTGIELSSGGTNGYDSESGHNNHHHTVPTLTHTVTQADAHTLSAHSVTQASAHTLSAHSVTQAASHGTLTHTVTQASAHTLSAHSVTQADAHTISPHSAESNEQPSLTWHYIIKT